MHAAESQPEGELHLTVIRADGTRNEIVRAALSTRNPIKRAWWNRVGQRLSERRANAVVQYLAQEHSVPLRRIVMPMGFGVKKPVADNSTPILIAPNEIAAATGPAARAL